MKNYKSQSNIQTHHCIPVSLLGYNWVENTFKVTKHEHKILHESLDIPYALVRRFRLRTNHLSVKPNQKYVDELRRLHLAYFARLDLLPLKLKKQHQTAMCGLVERFKKEFALQYEYKTYGSPVKQFHQHLKAYHQLNMMLI